MGAAHGIEVESLHEGCVQLHGGQGHGLAPSVVVLVAVDAPQHYGGTVVQQLPQGAVQLGVAEAHLSAGVEWVEGLGG